MDHLKRTGIVFGSIEAYAKRHLRIASIRDTTISISLQEAATNGPRRSPLLQLVDGASLSLADLRELVPSLGSNAWTFSLFERPPSYRLTTVCDSIEVALSLDWAERPESPLQIEGKLRGTAARLVVALSYTV